MRKELMRKLDAVWSDNVESHVTAVTAVTTALGHVTQHAGYGAGRVTETAVTPDEAPGYGGYVCYASETDNAEAYDEYEERAAIAQFCGGLPQAHAEVLAALHVAELGPERTDIIIAVAIELQRQIDRKHNASAADCKGYP